MAGSLKPNEPIDRLIRAPPPVVRGAIVRPSVRCPPPARPPRPRRPRALAASRWLCAIRGDSLQPGEAIGGGAAAARSCRCLIDYRRSDMMHRAKLGVCVLAGLPLSQHTMPHRGRPLAQLPCSRRLRCAQLRPWQSGETRAKKWYKVKAFPSLAVSPRACGCMNGWWISLSLSLSGAVDEPVT